MNFGSVYATMVVMEPTIQTKLDEILIITKENNQMLVSMRRLHRITLFFRVLYWCVLIGIAVGAFYFLQPYVTTIRSFGSSLPQSVDIESFFHQIQGK